jgi:hypothetical protein
MKKILFFLLIGGFVLSIQSCTKESPVDYNNSIIEQQVKIVEKIDELKKAIDNYNVLPADVAIDEMNVAYDKVIFQIDSAMAFIKTVEDFKGDNTLQKGAADLFIGYQSIIETEYKGIIELYKIPDAMFVQADQDKLDELLETSTTKLNTAYDNFTTTQAKFATDNNLVLE